MGTSLHQRGKIKSESQATDLRIFAIDTSNKGVTYRVYTHLLTINMEKMDTSFFKDQKM